MQLGGVFDLQYSRLVSPQSPGEVIPAFCNERFYNIKVLRDDFMKITDEFMEGPEPTTTEGASGCSLARIDYLIREALTA